MLTTHYLQQEKFIQKPGPTPTLLREQIKNKNAKITLAKTNSLTIQG